MLGSPFLDMIIGGGSFGLSSLIGFATKGFNTSAKKHGDLLSVMQGLGAAPKTEEDKQRDHDLALKEIEWRDKQSERTYDDLKSARGMTSRFVGITRRGLAWTTLFLLAVLAAVAFVSLFKGVAGVSIPTTSQHQILFGVVSWTTHGVQELKGLVWMPWFQMWFFMIGGFYFGREATK